MTRLHSRFRRQAHQRTHQSVLRRRLELESLERRQLLAGDGIDPDGALDVGLISGTKWEDLNGNGRHEPDEPGLPGVTIYVDRNNNGNWDSDEPMAITQKDDPATSFDEAGRYELARLQPGTYTIREIVPQGYRQTFPARVPVVDPTVDELASVEPRAMDVAAEPGEVISQSVSITIHPVCIRAFEFDVVPLLHDDAGVPGIEVVNRSGVQINGCGGDVSKFQIDVMILEPGEYEFDLGFVDRLGGDVLARIPVRVNGPSSGAHVVMVQPGNTVNGIDFGNTRLHPVSSSIEGRVWRDANGEGQQNARDRGLGGIELFLDLNDNGRPDFNEPRTRSSYENHVTDFEEAGTYRFDGLRPGEYIVRQIVPRAYQQSAPSPDAIVVDSQTGRFGPGSALDFRVSSVKFAPELTRVELSVQWPDGCGMLFADQTTHAVIGDTILVDVHGGEVGEVCTEALQTRSVVVDLPNLKAGDFRVAGTLHEQRGGGEQSTLGVVGQLRVGLQGGQHVRLGASEVVGNVDFLDVRLGPAESLAGTKWNDVNGDGVRQADEPGLGGVVIYLDLDENGKWTEGEPSVTTSEDLTENGKKLGSFVFENVEPGRYVVREIVPEGYQQTFPGLVPPPWLDGPEGDLLPEIIWSGWDAHHVELSPGMSLHGLDFGNRKTPDTRVGADSKLGDDPHASTADEHATPVFWEDGRIRVNSFLDDDADLDVFRFIAGGDDLFAEVSRFDGDSTLRLELLDAQGEPVWGTPPGTQMHATTVPGDVYFLRVAGAQGQYAVEVFESVKGVGDESVNSTLRSDMNGDRLVNFADFLVLSRNYGRQVDEAFADGDLDGDGMVAFTDFLILAQDFGS